MGNAGALILRGLNEDLLLAKGSFMDPQVSQRGLAALTHVWLPHEVCASSLTVISPDLFFVCWNTYAGQSCNLSQCREIDTDSGTVMWANRLRLIESVVWHPGGNDVFKGRGKHGRLYFEAVARVDLATQKVQRCPFEASPLFF